MTFTWIQCIVNTKISYHTVTRMITYVCRHWLATLTKNKMCKHCVDKPLSRVSYKIFMLSPWICVWQNLQRTNEQMNERKKERSWTWNTLASFMLTHLFCLCLCTRTHYALRQLFFHSFPFGTTVTFFLSVCVFPKPKATHFPIPTTWINLTESIINFFCWIKHIRGKFNSMLGYFCTRNSYVLFTAYRSYLLVSLLS